MKKNPSQCNPHRTRKMTRSPGNSDEACFFFFFPLSQPLKRKTIRQQRKKELRNKRAACMVVTNVVSDNLTERKTNNSYHNWGMVFITLQAPMIHQVLFNHSELEIA